MLPLEALANRKHSIREDSLKAYEWSDWRAIDTRPRSKGAAVYQFRLAVAGLPRPISRFLGVDDEGLLVIGSTGNMNQRITGSRSGVTRAQGSSTLGWIYYLQKHTDFLRAYPGCSYEYRFSPSASADEAEYREGQLLYGYWERFGELPPLNSSFPNWRTTYGARLSTASTTRRILEA